MTRRTMTINVFSRLDSEFFVEYTLVAHLWKSGAACTLGECLFLQQYESLAIFA